MANDEGLPSMSSPLQLKHASIMNVFDSDTPVYAPSSTNVPGRPLEPAARRSSPRSRRSSRCCERD
eukprot:3988259-Prymnesium_polylepis.1